MSPRSFGLLDTPLPRGTVLLEASAGTGKTYTITALFLRLLLEGVVERAAHALVVTFTVAATAELRGRLREGLRAAVHVFRGGAVPGDLQYLAELRRRHPDGLPVLERALQEYDELSVATIHGFCGRVLEEEAFESGAPFDREMIGDEAELLHLAIADLWRREIAGGSLLVGSAAVHLRLAMKELAETYRVLHRHPRTEMLPRPPAIAEAVRGLADAADGARRAWSGEAREHLAGIAFLKDALKLGLPHGHQPDDDRALFADLDAFAAGNDVHAHRALALGKAAGECDKYVSKKHHDRLDEPFLQACVALRDAARTWHLALLGQLRREVRRAFRSEKDARGLVGFNDLLEETRRAVADPQRGPALVAALRQRYGVALVDEFQDTDPRQWTILERVFDGLPLFLIGDPKQAIYGWRGADVFAYLTARESAVEHYTLDTNWRSSPELLEALDTVFAGHECPFVLPAIRWHGVRAGRDPADSAPGPPLEFWYPDHPGHDKENAPTATRRTIERVVAECRRLLDRGDVPAHGIAVLVRRNVEGEQVQTALRRAGIASVVQRAGQITHSDEALELAAVLGAVVHPGDDRRVRGALTTGLWGMPVDRATGLDDRAWQEVVECLAGTRRRWLREGFAAAAETLLEEIGTRPRLLARRDGERRWTNVLHLLELLHEQTRQRPHAPEATLQWLEHRLAAHDLEDERGQLRLESDRPAVRVVTVHGSKGLEFDVVLLPFLERPGGRPPPGLPFHREGSRVAVDFGSEDRDEHEARYHREELSEQMRLVYVGMTRARRRCCVVWGEHRDSEKSGLAWLLHARGAFWSESGLRFDDPSVFGKPLAGALKARAPARRAGLEDLAARSPGIAVAGIEAEPVEPADGERQGGTFAVRPWPRDRGLDSWRIDSFSSWTTGRPVAAEHADPERAGSSAALSSEAPSSAAGATGLFAFARGARAGTALHAVLERAEFTDLEPERTGAMVRRVLTVHGLARAGAHRGRLDPVAESVALLGRVAAADMPPGGGGFRLAEVPPEDRRAEWPFHLGLGRVRPRELAGVLEASGHPPAVRAAPRLGHLPAATVRGFLTGVVDLVVRAGGRYWVLDWKSNHLGDRAADYDGDALEAAMLEHDYVLQALLYQVALRRHLRQRGVDGGALGGAVYVFLRGLDGPAGGQWHDRTPPELLDAVDRTLGGGK